MKINFSNLPCWKDIRKQEKVNIDIKYQFSNIMYTQGSGIEIGALAMKIYNSDGEQEYTEKECNIILDFARNMNVMLYDSIEDLMKED